MPTLELIYDADCPNIDDARERIRAALIAVGLTTPWKEWDRADPAAPEYVRAWGSPTVLVDGCDVAGVAPAQAAACRLYANGQGRNQGVPPAEMIIAALTSAVPAPDRRAMQNGFSLAAMLPAIGAAALPKLTCPACWPAYAGLMSALGFGFIDYTPYLMPLMLGFLAVTLATLAWRAGARRGYGPLWLGLASAGIVLTGKFAFDSEGAVWSGIALLVAASLWNSWPRRKAGNCPACETGGAGLPRNP